MFLVGIVWIHQFLLVVVECRFDSLGCLGHHQFNFRLGVPRSSARSANMYFLPGRTSPFSAYDSMHLRRGARRAPSVRDKDGSQSKITHLLHGLSETFFPRRGAVRRFHVVKYSSQSPTSPRGCRPKGSGGDWGSRPAPSPQVVSACWLWRDFLRDVEGNR